MKYNVLKGNEVVKKNLSKKQAEEYCDKMNKEFMEKQESIRKQEHNAGLPLRKSKYELYKVEVVKESKIVRLTESDLIRIVKKVINEQQSTGATQQTKIGNFIKQETVPTHWSPNSKNKNILDKLSNPLQYYSNGLHNFILDKSLMNAFFVDNEGYQMFTVPIKNISNYESYLKNYRQ